MKWLKFRILSLLILTTAVCALLAWLVQPEIVTAKATFLVKIYPGSLMSDEKTTDREIDSFRQTTQGLVTSSGVLNVALANPKLGNSSLLKSQEDPVRWLEDHLEVEFEGDSELLCIRLSGPQESATDLVGIVDAVCGAFLDQIVRDNRLDRIREKDTLIDNHRKLRDEIRRKLEQLGQLRSDLGDDASNSPDYLLLQQDVEALSEVSKDLTIRIEAAELHLQSPARIQLTESAYLTED